MKNVLMVAYYFPPLGGGGVQRTAKFVKYLRDFGYNPVVLTVEPRCVRKVKDPTLLADIPAGTEIHRTFTIDADWLFKLLYGLRMVWLVRWLVRTVFVPDIQILWLPFARRKIRKIVRSRSIDLVFHIRNAVLVLLPGRICEETIQATGSARFQRRMDLSRRILRQSAQRACPEA